MRRRRASQAGQSLVEFALVLPLLIILTFGIIEFGILIYDQQILTNASREGARAGIVASETRLPPTGTPSIDSVVQAYCAQHLVTFGTRTPPVTTVTGYSAAAVFGSDLRVQVDYQYSFLIIPNFITSIARISTLQAVTVMKYE